MKKYYTKGGIVYLENAKLMPGSEIPEELWGEKKSNLSMLKKEGMLEVRDSQDEPEIEENKQPPTPVKVEELKEMELEELMERCAEKGADPVPDTKAEAIFWLTKHG